ncbi:MFS transporter [Mariniluteicoccus endophyticus]
MSTPEPNPSPPLAPLAVGLIAGIFATAFESIGVGTAMPRAAAELDGISWYAWAFSLFVIGMLAGNVAGGRDADRHGPLRTLVAGMLVFAVGLVVSGAAPTMAQLLTGRLVQGLGAGALNVGLYVVVAHAFPEDKRPLMMTGFSAAWVLPAFVGPPAAAWITEHLSWHWVFYAVLPLLALGAVLALPPLLALQRARTPHEEDSSPVPMWVGLLLALAAVGLQYAGQRAATTPDVWAALCGAAGLALLVVALPRIMPRGLLTLAPGLPAVMMTRALIAGTFFAAEAFLPLMLVEARGLSIGRAGLLLTIGSVGWFVGSWLQSRPWLRLGRHHVIVAGTAATTLGILGCALVAGFPRLPVLVAWIVWTFAGLGMGLVIASTGLATMTLSRVSEQGRNASALQAGESLGNSLVAALAGTLFARLHGGGDLVLTFGVVLGSMVVLGVWSTLTALRIGPVVAPSRDFGSVGGAS